MAVDGSGNVFVSDPHNNVVKEILAAGGYATINTLGSGFSDPFGVAVDGIGNVFVADEQNNAVKEILAAGGYTTVKTLGSGFNQPFGVAVDGSGNVFVADAGHNAVKEILAAGGYTTVKTLGSGFNQSFGVAVDPAGNVYVADSGNNAVKEILAASGYTTVVTLASGFSAPLSVAVDSSGNVFVADTFNNAVDKLDLFDPPALSFASTAAGSTSSDSPQTVTLQNIGNLPLFFSSVVYPKDFPEDASGDATDCTSSTSLASAYTCTLTIDFSPLAGSTTGSSQTLKESVNVTTDTLNTTATLQKIAVSGTETAAKLASTLKLKASSTTPTIGSPITLTATASGTGVIPTGTVTFYASGKAIGSPVALSAGVATLSTTPAASGTLTAVYSGDAVYTGATSNTVTVTLKKATPAVMLSATPNPAALGATVTFTATVSETISGVAPTGTVQFYVGGALTGAGTLSGGKATYATSALLTGAHSISATYTGGGNYLAASSTSVTETVNKAAPAVKLSATPNPAALGATVTFTATVSTTTQSVVPAGTVTFFVDSKQAGTGKLSGGKATYSTGALLGGAHSISVTYGGDANYSAANSTSVTETVNKATPSVTLSSTPNPAALGATVTFTATVSTTIASVAPTGTVAFLVDGKQAGTGTLSGGKATYSTSTLAAGTHTIKATYTGDGNYLIASSTSGTETVNKAKPTVTLTASPGSPVASGTKVTFTASVSTTTAGVAPTGTVAFFVDGKQAGTGKLSAGKATYSTTTLTVAKHTIYATYAGDSNYVTATSATGSLTVTK